MLRRRQLGSGCLSRIASNSTHGGAHGSSSSIGNFNHGSARRSSTWNIVSLTLAERRTTLLRFVNTINDTAYTSCPKASSKPTASQRQRHGHDHCCAPPVCCFVGFAGAGTRRLDTAGCWFGVRPVKPRSMVSGFVVVGLLDAFVQDV